MALDLAGVDENAIKRQGRWNTEIVTKVYLSNLPREAMLANAGFSPKISNEYFLPRASVEPPASLASQIFPDLDAWLARHQDVAHGIIARRAGKISTREDNADNVQEDMAALGFLSLLKKLRTVILQDAPILMAEFPSATIFQRPIFKTDEFRAWAYKVQEVHSAAQLPKHIQVQQVLPTVWEAINNSRSDTLSAIKKQSIEAAQFHAEALERLRQVGGALQQAKKQQYTMTMTPITEEAGGASDFMPALAMTTTMTTGSSVAVTLAQSKASTTGIEAYRCDRNISNVLDVLVKWQTGWNGGPPVETLAKLPQGQWSLTEAERKFFNRRRTIIKWIIEAEGYDSVNAAALALDHFCNRQENKTLHHLQQLIGAAKKARRHLFDNQMTGT